MRIFESWQFLSFQGVTHRVTPHMVIFTFWSSSDAAKFASWRFVPVEPPAPQPDDSWPQSALPARARAPFPALATTLRPGPDRPAPALAEALAAPMAVARNMVSTAGAMGSPQAGRRPRRPCPPPSFPIAPPRPCP
jgi:hypothetical protein